MSNGLKPGMWVQSKFGNGKITEVSGDFAFVMIQREHGQSHLRIACRDLLSHEQNTSSKPAQPTIALSRPVAAIGQSPGLKALHSLRFGLVPHEMLQELTHGYTVLRSWVCDCLPDGPDEPPKVSEIFGQYGTGKSHTMAVVRHVAKQEGYVVARVEVDGVTVSLSDPRVLLSNLWDNLEAKDLHSATPLLDIYLRAIERRHNAPSFAPAGIDRIYHNYRTLDLLKRRGLLEKYEVEYDSVLSCHDEIRASDLHRDICREPMIDCGLDSPRVVPMIGKMVDDRPYDFIEAVFGTGLVCQLAGYKGLVVTVDEFEVEHFSGGRWKRVVALINALKRYLNNKTDHDWAPVSLFFATIGEAGHRGDEVIDELVELTQGDYYQLEELSWNAVSSIGDKIRKLYYEVYGIPPGLAGPDMRDIWQKVSIDSGKVRSFIKHYMAALDSNFGPPRYP